MELKDPKRQVVLSRSAFYHVLAELFTEATLKMLTDNAEMRMYFLSRINSWLMGHEPNKEELFVQMTGLTALIREAFPNIEIIEERDEYA